MRKRRSRFGLLRKLHSERIPEMHWIEPVLFVPTLAKYGDQWCFPSMRRSADSPSLPKGAASIQLHGDALYKDVVWPAVPRNQSVETCAPMTSESVVPPLHTVVDNKLGEGGEVLFPIQQRAICKESLLQPTQVSPSFNLGPNRRWTMH